jgi:hypothetical protein
VSARGMGPSWKTRRRANPDGQRRPRRHRNGTPDASGATDTMSGACGANTMGHSCSKWKRKKPTQKKAMDRRLPIMK